MDSVLNASISLPSGEVLYEISTPPGKKSPTTIRKQGIEIGVVELRGACNVNGKEYVPVRGGGMFKSGTTLTFSNGSQYTWKHDSSKRKSHLIPLSPPEGASIATYHHPPIMSRELVGNLAVTTSDTQLTDEIFATSVYVEQRRRFSVPKMIADSISRAVSAAGMVG
ncbi:hypothetical protein PQX77_021628 [Marasmius sp. AFHP31]|nr:hypothetical protein PQX77_021628 [Marasmius sp. AFHP31]